MQVAGRGAPDADGSMIRVPAKGPDPQTTPISQLADVGMLAAAFRTASRRNAFASVAT